MQHSCAVRLSGRLVRLALGNLSTRLPETPLE